MYSKLAIASIIPKKLYSMQFDDYDDEFSRAFQFWNTPEALKDFFLKSMRIYYPEDLNSNNK